MATLYTFEVPQYGRILKLLAAAKIANYPIEIKGMEFGKEHKAPEFMRNCSPQGGLPVLQAEEGYIFESNAILRHIARMDKANFLYGRTAFEASQVDMWLDYTTTEVDSFSGRFYARCFGMNPDEATVADCKKQLECACGGIELWLENRTFLVGERLTIADLELALTLDGAFRYAPEEITEPFAKAYKSVMRHYNTVMNQPKVVEAILATGGVVALPKAEKKKEAPAPAAKKEEEKKPKKEAAPAEADDEDGGEHEEKKKPNPLDLLPPSPFVLDAFKREYSNKDCRKEAAPFFFSNYDPAGFSCYWCHYKYNDELQKPFMTSNLVRGWFQRMESNRKYAFGSVLIIGEEKKHEIVGFWVFRGRGLPQSVTEVDDVEHYAWTEIADVKAEMAKITDFLAWDGDFFKASPLLEGRIFK